MRRSLHTDEEIAFLLREAENGVAIATICASAHVSLGTFYRWRRRLGGLLPAGVARLEQIEQENARLRAEVLRLRRSLLFANPIDAGLDDRRSARTAVGQRQPAPVRYRGQDASVGRFAFVRNAN